MLRLLSRPFRRRGPVRRTLRPRLGLQRLEARDTPAAPVLTMATRSVADGLVEVYGSVQDENPAAAVVRFTGAITGQALPDAEGNYLVQLQATGDGPIVGQAQDVAGLFSDPQFDATGPYERSLDGDGGPGGDGGGGGGMAPTLFWWYEQIDHRKVIIEGGVLDDDPAGLTVTFSGSVQGTAVTDATGGFSVTLTATALGTMTGSVFDDDGWSDSYDLDLQNTTPVIAGFGASLQSGTWMLTGAVLDDYAPGLTVRFSSSIAAVDGHSAVVDADNDFSFCFTAPPRGGLVEAVVTDWWGVDSEEVYLMIA